MKHNVLITGIGGGGVGRQIIKAIKLTDLPVKLFGSDTSTVSFGKMDVDDFSLLPSASDEDYINTLLSKCLQNKIKGERRVKLIKMKTRRAVIMRSRKTCLC